MRPLPAALACALLAVATSAAADPATPRPALHLSAQEVSGAQAQNKVFGGLLCRELERQALLLAARDELGLRTHDAALGETPATDDTALALLTHNLPGNRSLVELSRPVKKSERGATGAEEKAANAVGQAEFKLPPALLADYAPFTAETERQSRTDFVQLLRKAGVMRGQPEAPVAWAAAAPVSPQAAAALQLLNPYSQLAAARLLHAQMRESGASPERLTALVHAYANLGLLTQFLWNADAKVFAARSLLYAQRLAVHENNSPDALRTRAYARALAGLHRLALDDLAAAGNAQPPDWQPAIAAFCRYDLDAELAESTTGRPAQPLASLLAAAIARDSAGPDRTVDITNASLAALPDNSFLLQTLWHTDLLPIALNVPDQMLHALPTEASAGLASLHLPALADKIDAASDIATTADNLAKADDDGEPSLALFASLLRDHAFAVAADTLIMERQRLDDTDENVRATANALAPLWKSHPNAAYIESLAASPRNKQAQAAALLKKWKPRDPGRWIFDGVFMDTQLWSQLNGRDGVDWFSNAYANLDLTPFDYSIHVIEEMNGAEDIRRLDAARRESPNSALLFAGYLRHYAPEKRRENPAAVEAILADAEARFANRPAVNAITGQWACDLNEFSRGIDMMAAAMKADPTVQLGQPLVEAYLHVHDVDNAKLIADQALAVNNVRRGEGEVLADKLAAALLTANRPEDAWFYAKIAADTDASWGYRIAAACEEKRGHLDEAAAWLEKDTDLYPASAAEWKLWATRTGHSSLPAATAAADAFAKSHPDDPANAWSALAAGDYRTALKAFARDERHFNVNDWALYAALAALAKDKRALEHGLTQLENSKKPFGLHLAAAARGNQTAFEVDHLAVLREADWRNDHASADLQQTALLLAATGHNAEALPLLLRSLHDGYTVTAEYALTWEALKRLGQNPAALVAQPLPTDDPAPLLGQWRATVADAPAQWTLARDGSASTKSGQHGGWRLEDHRLIVLFSSHEWAVCPLPSGPGAPVTLTGSSDKGPATATLSRGDLP